VSLQPLVPMRHAARGSRKRCAALLVAAVLVASIAGCAARSRDGERRSNPELLTADEITGGHWSNAHSAISALRPRWLINRGPDTILGQMGDVQVLLDGVPIGRPAVLMQVPTIDIAYIRFVEPTAAAARWGPTYAHGVIYIATRPLAEGSTTP
jgi:hypothetical protein